MEVDIFGVKGLSNDAILNPFTSTMIIAGYWWGRGNVNRNSREGKTYDQLADRLVDQCTNLGINYCIIEIPEFAVKGGYQKAINFKPMFIKYMMLRYPDLLICSIDTDMMPVSYPYLLENPDYDFISFNWTNEVRIMGGILSCYSPYVLKTSGGIICIRNTEATLNLVDEWADYSVRYPGKAEDRTITAAFESKKYIEKLRCLWLPMEYLWLPYFYEMDIDYEVPKKYAKYFRGKVDKNGYSTRECTVQKFFGIKDKDIIVVHPEALTEEEEAASQGADPDRIPYEWYYYSGIKRRCLSSKDKLVNNPNTYLEEKEHIVQLKPLNTWKDRFGFAKYVNKKLSFKHKVDINKLSFIVHVGNSPYAVVSICNDDSKARQFRDFLTSYDITHIIYVGSNLEKYKPFLIHTAISDMNMDVLYLDANVRVGKKELVIDTQYDFGCINASATPVFKAKYVGKICNDGRVLQCVTSDILFFKNSFFAKNLLMTWDHEIKRGVQDRIALSIAFNKYGFILPMRVNWLDPNTLAYTSHIYIDSYFPGAWTFLSEKHLPEWTRKMDIYTYLEQCGTRPPIEDEHGNDKIYFSSGKYIQ